MGCSNSGTINTCRKRDSKTIKMFKKEIGELYINYKFKEIFSNSGRVKKSKVLHLPTNQIRLCKQIFKKNIVGSNNVNSYTDQLFETLCQIDDHLNIPKVFEYFEDDISIYIIVELACGKKLLNFIEFVENFTERQVAIIMEQLFSCLNYLHENDIIHGNVFPENIILDSERIGNYYLKLVNFEKASLVINKKLEEEKDVEREKYGNIYFLSPDRLNGKKDFKDDMWSCGIIMYLLLCGYPPFISEHLDSLQEKIKKGKFEFVQKDWANISKEGRTLVEKLLILNPKKRISSNQALNDPWINMHLKARNKEMEKKVKGSELQVNTKIRKFSGLHSLELAVMSFIVRQTSTNNQANQLRDIFKLMDVNREGRLTYQELSDGYKKFFKNTPLSHDEYMEIVKSFDRDGNENVEFEEFLTAFLKSELILTEKNLKFAFDYFDEDKSGQLSADEIKRILSFNKSSFNEEDVNIEEIINSFDKDSDGNISYDEFVNLMKKILAS